MSTSEERVLEFGEAKVSAPLKIRGTSIDYGYLHIEFTKAALTGLLAAPDVEGGLNEFVTLALNYGDAMVVALKERNGDT